ncbi:MAG: amino acid ABC transporter substrate-binding protein [Bacilli bacterium]|jgi:polar amino acid transport system substrate-binding protein|nr:amino acid ABC transporter substrate-binding protein [Bacilli bacterium]
MKKIITLTMALFLIISLSACGSKNETSDTMKKDTLIVGLDDTFAPMGFKDKDGKIIGFDVDLANEVGKIIGKKMQFQPIDWSMKETELNNKNIDLIWNGYSITEERKKQVLFSEPYIDNEQIIVVLKDSPITKKSDLAGKTVTTQKDSSTEDAFKNDTTGIVSKFKGGAPVLYPTFDDCFMDLDSKRADALVGDSVLIKYMIKQKDTDKYRILTDTFGSEEMGVGMRKSDTDLKKAIDDALNELKANGTYQKIYDKWFD